MILHIGIEPDKLEDDKQNILVMPFQITDQLVRGIGKETLQAAEEGIGLAAFDLADKFAYLERGLYFN